MNDNISSYVSRVSREFLECKSFTGDKIIEWQLSSLNLNPIENLQSIMKIKLYESSTHDYKANLWETIKQPYYTDRE